MNRLLIFLGMTVGGYGGWWVGDYFQMGLPVTLVVSSMGSLVGVIAAWKIGRDFLG
jgi:hypothetical protein